MKTIGKTTKSKMTKEAQARKIFDNFTIEQKNELYLFLGRIAVGDIKNFYSTRFYKTLAKELSFNERAVVAYICRKVGQIKMFENMDELVLAEGK